LPSLIVAAATHFLPSDPNIPEELAAPGSSERLGAAAAANGVPDQKLGASGAASGSTFSKNYRLRYLSNCIIFYNKYLET